MVEWKSIEQILDFAKNLEDSSIGEQKKSYPVGILKEGPSKGGFGQYLENAFFGIETNSLSVPDFSPIPLELKATPLKYNTSGELVPKERLVLNIINYYDTAEEESIETSHFMMKNAAILLIWYVHASAENYKDFQIKLTGLWECMKEDCDQITQDWTTIIKKIKQGKAHEISEGDTLYLGACTKGSTAEESFRNQPFSSIPAKQRAFCFKKQYMRTIYQRMLERKRNLTGLKRFCKASETVQEKILEMVRPYIGRTVKSLQSEFGIKDTKNLNNKIILRILGTNGKRPENVYYEFAAADIQIKTIKVDENGKNRESMSFPAIKYTEIVNEEWEDSVLYSQLTRKFLCPIFVFKTSIKDYVLDRCTIWNMPESDLDIVREVWENTKKKIKDGDYEHFTRISQNRVTHVRPHANNAEDKMETPQGTMEKKKSFWLNASYIYDSIVNLKVQYDFDGE
jgi:DNA mismatch repair enzyme MutH.